MPEEMVEEVNSIGNPTGRILLKSEAHAKEVLHSGAHGFITDGQGNLLCQRRGHECSMMRDVWDPIGVAGHISAWDPKNGPRPDSRTYSALTLMREMSEEIGYELPDLEFFNGPDAVFIGTTHTDMVVEDGWRHRVVDFNWVLRQPDIDPDTCRLEEGKVEAVELRPIDEVLRGALAPNTQYAVRLPDHEWLIRTACVQAHRMTL